MERAPDSVFNSYLLSDFVPLWIIPRSLIINQSRADPLRQNDKDNLKRDKTLSSWAWEKEALFLHSSLSPWFDLCRSLPAN